MGITHSGTQFRICATAQTPTLDQAAFDALTYVPVTGIVTVPSLNVEQNTISENTVDTDITSVAGGLRQGQTSTITFSFKEITDAGFAAMEAAAQSGNLFAVQVELNNSQGANGTTYSALCFIGGGGGPTGGGVEDFAQRTYTLTPSDQLPLEKAAA